MLYRSSIGKRGNPSQNTYDYKLKCVICDKIKNNGISRKYRICEKGRAESLREAAMFLADHVYTRIADLNTDERMFSADIYYHVNCFAKYIQRFKIANAPSVLKSKEQTGKRFIFQNYIKFIDEVITRGNGIALSEIRDMINTNEDINIKNNEVKNFLEEFFGDSIQFCESDRQNQSTMVYSSSLDVTDVINTLRSLDGVKSTAQITRDKLLNIDFGLQDKFCDAEELKLAWRTTKIPDELLVFFSELFNINKTTLLKDY